MDARVGRNAGLAAEAIRVSRVRVAAHDVTSPEQEVVVTSAFENALEKDLKEGCRARGV